MPSPTVTSHSSTSRRVEPTVPSIHSSHSGTGVAFPPSRHTSPATAYYGSPTSITKSTSSGPSFFFAPRQPLSELDYIPESNEGAFFSQPVEREPVDMRSIWSLVQERKREDTDLRAECGWASQSESGMSASHGSQWRQSQSRDGYVNSPMYEQRGVMYPAMTEERYSVSSGLSSVMEEVECALAGVGRGGRLISRRDRLYESQQFERDYEHQNGISTLATEKAVYDKME